MYFQNKNSVKRQISKDLHFLRLFSADFEGMLSFQRIIAKISNEKSSLIDVEADADNFNCNTYTNVIDTKDIDFDAEVFDSLAFFEKYLKDLCDSEESIELMAKDISTKTPDYFLDTFDKTNMMIIHFESYEDADLKIFISKEIYENSYMIKDLFSQVNNPLSKDINITYKGERITFKKPS